MHHPDVPVTLLETSALQGQVDEVVTNAFFIECIQRRYFPGGGPLIALIQLSVGSKSIYLGPSET